MGLTINHRSSGAVTTSVGIGLMSSIPNSIATALARLDEQAENPIRNLLAKFGDKIPSGSVNDLATETLVKLEILKRKLAEVDSKELQIVRKLEDSIQAFIGQRQTISKLDSLQGSLLEYAAAVQALDQIIYLSSEIGNSSSLLEILKQSKIVADSNTGGETASNTNTDLSPIIVEAISLGLKNNGSSNNSGGGDSWVKGNWAGYTGADGWARNDIDRQRREKRINLLEPLAKGSKDNGIDHTDLAEKLDYINEFFPEILARKNVDEIFTALAHTFHPFHLNTDEKLEIKASFNKNKDEKNNYRNQFIEALKVSPQLRESTRAYIYKNLKTISKHSSSEKTVEDWLYQVFDHQQYGEPSIVSAAFCFEDLKDFSVTDLENSFNLFTKNSHIGCRGNSEKLFLNLIKITEIRLKDTNAKQDYEKLEELKTKVLEKIGKDLFYGNNTDKSELTELTRIYTKYKPNEYKTALLKKIIGYVDNNYFQRKGIDGLSFIDYIFRNNPVPNIFRVEGNSIGFTEAFSRELLKNFKEFVINILGKKEEKTYLNKDKSEQVIQIAEFLNEWGIETKGLFGDEELQAIFPNSGERQIFDITHPNFLTLERNNQIIWGVNPFKEDLLARANAKIFKLLTARGIAPNQTNISQELINKAVDENISQVRTNYDIDCNKVAQLFIHYLPNDIKREILSRSFGSLEIIDQIGFLGLSFDNFFPELAAPINPQQQQIILDLINQDRNQKYLLEALNKRMETYLLGYDGTSDRLKIQLDAKQVQTCHLLANLCLQNTYVYDLQHSLRKALENLNNYSVKSALEPIFKQYLQPTLINKEFFDLWKNLDDFEARLLATRIIRNQEKRANNLGAGQYMFLNDNDDLPKLRTRMNETATSFHPNSLLGEILKDSSLPWIFSRIFSRLLTCQVLPEIQAFMQQSDAWHRAERFAQNLSKTTNINEPLRLASSKITIGFPGSSPALLRGSGEHNGSRRYTPGDDPRLMDNRAWGRTDKRFTKTLDDDADLRPKVYIIDLESLVTKRTKDQAREIIGLEDYKKIETLLSALCKNKGKQSLQIYYKSTKILDLDNLQLRAILDQGPNSVMQDQYGKRNKLMDLYLSLNLLTNLIASYSSPFSDIVTPIVNDDIWRPKVASQIFISPANNSSLLHKGSLEAMQRWRNSEIMKIDLEPQTATIRSPRLGVLANMVS